jgi:hypothetical protein
VGGREHAIRGRAGGRVGEAQLHVRGRRVEGGRRQKLADAGEVVGGDHATGAAPVAVGRAQRERRAVAIASAKRQVPGVDPAVEDGPAQPLTGDPEDGPRGVGLDGGGRAGHRQVAAPVAIDAPEVLRRRARAPTGEELEERVDALSVARPGDRALDPLDARRAGDRREAAIPLQEGDRPGDERQPQEIPRDALASDARERGSRLGRGAQELAQAGDQRLAEPGALLRVGEDGEELRGGLALAGAQEIAVPPARERERGADQVAEVEAGRDDPLRVHEPGVSAAPQRRTEGPREPDRAALAVGRQQEVDGLVAADETVADPYVGEDRRVLGQPRTGDRTKHQRLERGAGLILKR